MLCQTGKICAILVTAGFPALLLTNGSGDLAASFAEWLQELQGESIRWQRLVHTHQSPRPGMENEAG
jgi:ribonucleotide monophosphatase NagD (HAD superfamily)